VNRGGISIPFLVVTCVVVVLVVVGVTKLVRLLRRRS
jgi:hypothetical protein